MHNTFPPQNGGTPLCLAAAKGHVVVVSLLLEMGADKDTADMVGEAGCRRGGETRGVQVDGG